MRAEELINKSTPIMCESRARDLRRRSPVHVQFSPVLDRSNEWRWCRSCEPASRRQAVQRMAAAVMMMIIIMVMDDRTDRSFFVRLSLESGRQ